MHQDILLVLQSRYRNRKHMRMKETTRGITQCHLYVGIQSSMSLEVTRAENAYAGDGSSTQLNEINVLTQGEPNLIMSARRRLQRE